MKNLDELKISPAPWKVGTKGVPRCVLANNGIVAEGIDDANARLIAAAPELYEALREAVVEMCNGCDYCDYNDGQYDCRRDEECCFVRRWRDVLAKASDVCNGGDCERHSIGAEPCAGCKFVERSEVGK